MVWEYDERHPPTLYGQAAARLGEEASNAVDTMMDAYHELSTKVFKTADELRAHFLQGDKPMFTRAQAESVFKKTQAMRGGTSESVVNDGLASIVNIISGKTTPGPPNPAIKAAIATIQQAIRIILPFVFILNTLEQSPLFGELLGAALDITTSVLPVTASTVQTSTPALVGLIPLPFAGPVGIALGWLFSFFFLWLAMVIGISRKDFAGALEATAGMIPIIGGTAMKSVATFDRVTTKLANRAERIQQSISNVYGSLQNAVQNVKNAAALQTPIVLPPVRTGGKRLTRRKKYKNKWRKTLHRSKRR